MRILLLVWLVTIGSCAWQRGQVPCNLQGILHKTDNLDGCAWLIITKEGKRLLPQNAQHFDLKDLLEVNFSYTTFEGMSICMAEDEIITLTCLQTLPTASCQDIIELEQLSWLQHEVDTGNPVSVYRFVHGGNFLFKVTYATKSYIWFDCLGRVMCQSDEGCALIEKDMTQKTPIFLAHR